MDYSLGVWELREAERTEEAKNQKWNSKSYLTTKIIEQNKKLTDYVYGENLVWFLIIFFYFLFFSLEGWSWERENWSFSSIGLAAGLCRNRRGRETAATASRTGGVGRQPLLNGGVKNQSTYECAEEDNEDCGRICFKIPRIRVRLPKIMPMY